MKTLSKTLCVGLVILIAVATPVASLVTRAEACGANPFLGQICIFAFNFCPLGFAAAAGQILPIAQNLALFSLLGNTYGGNGTTTFALPDLRGRTARGTGQGPGLADVALGEEAGAETVTLTVNQMPSHTHTLMATTTPGNRSGPGNLPAHIANQFNSTSAPNVAMGAQSIQSTGGSQPHSILSPYLGLTHCIAVQGIFPSQ